MIIAVASNIGAVTCIRMARKLLCYALVHATLGQHRHPSVAHVMDARCSTRRAPRCFLRAMAGVRAGPGT
jgi:hypothetical protein